MIYRKRDDKCQNSIDCDLILDDIVLSDFGESSEHLEHLVNVDCALALSICKTRNLPSCVFVLSLLYMKRLRSLHSSTSLIKIDNLTTKELYLIAALLADKNLIDEGEDEQLFNSELAELTGIEIERINLIERQVLFALNWNLHVSNDEFKQFFSLFKSQMAKKLNKNIEKLDTDDTIKFYSICFKLLPHFIEYIALTSLVLVASTISLLTAIHIGTVTHSTLMNTLHPTIHCPHSSSRYWNTNSSLTKQNDISDFENNPWIINKTIDNNYDFYSSANSLCNMLSTTHSSGSIDIIRSPSFSRSMIESFG